MGPGVNSTNMPHKPDSNGKATIGLVVQITAIVIGLIGAVATPLIMMYSKLQTLEVMVTERLGEVETQFRAADNMRNVNLAAQMRVNALLWQKVFEASLPTEVYYPEISNRR